MKIRPLQDRIVAERIDLEQTTPSGIIIPDSAKEKPQEAKVLEVGPGRMGDDGKIIPMEVQKGDRLLLSQYAGNEMSIAGREVLVLSESDVLAVLE